MNQFDLAATGARRTEPFVGATLRLAYRRKPARLQPWLLAVESVQVTDDCERTDCVGSPYGNTSSSYRKGCSCIFLALILFVSQRRGA